MRESFEAECGTVTGARRHRRLGEPPCEACAAGEARTRRQARHAATPPPVDPMSDLWGSTVDDPQPPPPGDWALQGACVGHPNPDLWFPRNTFEANEAIAICHRCPVERQCLEHAVRVGEPHGIWGGRSERARRRIRATARRGAA